jgi:hypothetical protein
LIAVSATSNSDSHYSFDLSKNQMKPIFLPVIFLICLSAGNSFGQGGNSKISKDHKFELKFAAGVNTYLYFSEEYSGDSVPDSLKNLLSTVGQFPSRVYHYKYHSVAGFQAGAFLYYHFYKPLYLKSGVLFINSNRVAIRTPDSYSEPEYESVERSVRKFYSLQIPILLGVSKKNLRFDAGILINLFTHQTEQLVTADKIKLFETHQSYFVWDDPWLQASINSSYNFMLKKTNISPAIGINFLNYFKPHLLLSVEIGFNPKW